MGLANEMKNLSEEMLSSFKERVKDNEYLITSVEKKLQQYRNDQEKLADNLSVNAAELQKNLEAGEKERVENYSILMDSIRKDIKSIESDVMSTKTSSNALIKEFSKTRKAMAGELSKELSEENKMRLQNEQLRMADYELYIKKISDEVAGIFSYTNDMLEKFGNEHREMSEELKADLSKTRQERFEYTHKMIQDIQGRIKDIGNENKIAALNLRKDLDTHDTERLIEFNTLFEKIRSEVEELKKSTADLLGSYSEDRLQGAKYWAQMQQKISAIQGGEQEEPVKIKEIEKSENEVKSVPTVVEVKETGIVGEKEKKEVVEIPVEKEQISLEVKILNYINSHIEGVKVSDMEEPLHETRMKIGFAAKCLLDAGKVSKNENLYYPAKKK